MKGILEFQLPEDREDFAIAQKGWTYKHKVDEICDLLRRYEKYEELNKTERLFFEKLCDQIRAIARDED
jgi:hypothetical protein